MWKIKTKSFYIVALFASIIFNSCSKEDSFKGEIDPDACIEVTDIGSSSANIRFSNFDNSKGHALVVTKREGGSEIFSDQPIGIPKFENLEPGQNYIARIDVEGYETSPYESVEFTTLPFDFILSSNMEGSGRFRTETDFDVELTTDGGKGNKLTNYAMYLVDSQDESFIIKLDVKRNDSKLTFKVLEDFLSIPETYQKNL